MKSLGKDVRFYVKTRALNLVLAGWPRKLVAAALGIHGRTLQEMIRSYREHNNVVAPDQRKYNGRARRLTTGQLSVIVCQEELQKSAALTLKERAGRLKRKYDINISSDWIR